MSDSITSTLSTFLDTIQSVAQAAERATRDLGNAIDTLNGLAGEDFAAALQRAQSTEPARTAPADDGDPDPQAEAPRTPTGVTDNATSADAWLPEYLLQHQARYEAISSAQEQWRTTQDARWAGNPEALRMLQQVYHPSVSARSEAVDWLQQNMGVGWRATAPHVMETGNLLGSELPEYLARHQDRYEAMAAADTRWRAHQEARWADNTEALLMYQQTYSPDTEASREAIAWLEENMGVGWRATAPHIMETGELLAAAMPDSLAESQRLQDINLARARAEQAMIG